ncbi:sigma-70 family RNA polymerase sigma factor [Zavarzinella formosa]|uniref:sigma-70 family RNA polymerase sigma factor n=1 Tax=Zavarzinella formosa TaxID=360055 RepID=UPI0002ECD780|nr:sigma-70 family RNA polymerase sigma factor [Zavarzinella formosa]
MSRDVREILAAAKAGDSEVLGRLLEGYRQYLSVLAGIEIGRRLQGKVDQSDLVQEVFLHAHQYFPAFRGTEEAQLIVWLREILAGTLANQVRRYVGTQARDIRLEEGLAADLGQSSAMLAAVPVSPEGTPSEQLMHGEVSLAVAGAIAGLPEHYRTVIVLRHLEGLSFPEVASRMGKTVDSVEKIWVRALGSLRAALREKS